MKELSLTAFSSHFYLSEIGFFDFYIIPLARQLQQCEIFGSLADECLEYAQRNRARWVQEGHVAIQEMKVAQMSDADILEMIDNVMAECDVLLDADDLLRAND